MELICSVCKGKIDIEKELALFFQCYVYCEKCQKEMEGKGGICDKGVNKEVKSALDSY